MNKTDKRRIEQADHHVLIICDAHDRAKVVTNFVRIEVGMFAGQWVEIPASRAGDSVGTGSAIVRDKPAESGWALDSEISNDDHRTRYELECRWCAKMTRNAGTPVDLREETLFKALDSLATRGESRIALRQLAAMV